MQQFGAFARHYSCSRSCKDTGVRNLPFDIRACGPWKGWRFCLSLPRKSSGVVYRSRVPAGCSSPCRRLYRKEKHVRPNIVRPMALTSHVCTASIGLAVLAALPGVCTLPRTLANRARPHGAHRTVEEAARLFVQLGASYQSRARWMSRRAIAAATTRTGPRSGPVDQTRGWNGPCRWAAAGFRAERCLRQSHAGAWRRHRLGLCAESTRLGSY